MQQICFLTSSMGLMSNGCGSPSSHHWDISGTTTPLNPRYFIQALVDSGNLFGDIMCEKLAKMLKLQYYSCFLKARTAVSGQQVQILGKTNPMDLILEGLPTPESPIAPFVIRIVFETNKAEIKFEGTKVTLKLINKLIELVNRSLPVVGNSTKP